MVSQIEEDTGSLPEDLPRGVSQEIAAANPDVQGIIIPRTAMLIEIADSFLSTIIDSLDTVPYGIRWICKQIRSLTRVSPRARILPLPPKADNERMLFGWVEKIFRGLGPFNLFVDRRVFLPEVHQPGRRDPSSVHAGRWRTRQTS